MRWSAERPILAICLAGAGSAKRTDYPPRIAVLILFIVEKDFLR